MARTDELAELTMPTELLLALVGLAGTIAGGAGLEIVKRMFGLGERRLDDATAIRLELREEVTSLRNELRRVDAELDTWRTKYFEEVAQVHQLKAENHSIREENHELRGQMTILKLQIDKLQRTVDGMGAGVEHEPR
jgi:chromosome segregation ATPase